MSQADLLITMYDRRHDFNPPLEIKEILEFVEHELAGQQEYEERMNLSDRMKARQELERQWNFVNYGTKKELRQAITQTNKEIDKWVLNKRHKIGFSYDIEIEKCLAKKKKLQSRLQFKDWKGAGLDKERAKMVPIDQFIEFHGGFAKCLWHEDMSPSLKYYPKENKVHCFAGCGSHDVIDCIMKIHNLDFTHAVKFILT